MRTLIGIVVGILVAFGTVWAIDLVGHQIYPAPSDLDIRNFEAVGAYIQAMPPAALALVAFAWFAGALVGGITAALISRRHWTVWLMAAIAAAAGVLNVLMIPHPALLQVASVVAPMLGGLLASQLTRRRLEPAGRAAA